APDRVEDSYRHRDQKSYRIAGDSPDRLWLRVPGSIKEVPGERMASDSSIQYSIVVPFFNEQENIPPLYMKLTGVMDGIGEPYELVFVDDGSKDDSFKVLTEIFEHDRRVNLVRLRRNFGQTPALKAGFDFARGEVIISMDGDLQHDPEEIPRFLEKIEEGFDRRENRGSADRKSPSQEREVQLRNRAHHPGFPGFDYRQIFIGLFDAAVAIFRFARRGRDGLWFPARLLPGLRKVLLAPSNHG